MTCIHGNQPAGSRSHITRCEFTGGSIVGMLTDKEAQAIRDLPLGVECLNARGCIVTPGFVDLHVHITGGGGEAGGLTWFKGLFISCSCMWTCVRHGSAAGLQMMMP